MLCYMVICIAPLKVCYSEALSAVYAVVDREYYLPVCLSEVFVLVYNAFCLIAFVLRCVCVDVCVLTRACTFVCMFVCMCVRVCVCACAFEPDP